MPQDSQTSSLPLNQWRFVCMYVQYMIQYVCAFIPNYIENVQMSILATVLPLAKYKNPNSIYSMKLRIWSYIKTSSYSVKEKKYTHTHTSAFSDRFHPKVPLYPRNFTRSLGPLWPFRLVIPDPFLSVRRAIGTRFYAPPRLPPPDPKTVTDSRNAVLPCFGSGFRPIWRMAVAPQLPWVLGEKNPWPNRPPKSPRKNLGVQNRHRSFHHCLVGGWTNPFEKYARQIGFIFPKVRGEIKKYLKPPPSCVFVSLFFLNSLKLPSYSDISVLYIYI